MGDCLLVIKASWLQIFHMAFLCFNSLEVLNDMDDHRVIV